MNLPRKGNAADFSRRSFKGFRWWFKATIENTSLRGLLELLIPDLISEPGCLVVDLIVDLPLPLSLQVILFFCLQSLIFDDEGAKAEHLVWRLRSAMDACRIFFENVCSWGFYRMGFFESISASAKSFNRLLAFLF